MNPARAVIARCECGVVECKVYCCEGVAGKGFDEGKFVVVRFCLEVSMRSWVLKYVWLYIVPIDAMRYNNSSPVLSKAMLCSSTA